MIFKYTPVFLSCLIFNCAVAQQSTIYKPATPATGILTPVIKPTAKINGPSVFGVRQGSPFFYAIAASGKRPMQYTAQGLPAGLKIDEKTGFITGSLSKAGKYPITLSVKNQLGKVSKKFTIVVGEDIALTPPMGWNSYNVYGEGVDEDKAMRAAKAMVKFNLNQHGWTYINCDDGWQGERNKTTLAIQPDPQRFKDMRAYCDAIHAMGLKPGLYSSPWTKTYGGRLGGSAQKADGATDSTYNLNSPKNKKVLPFAIGKYNFADQDAVQYAQWGVDYLKYDWAPVEAPETKLMHDALRKTKRDIVFSLSNNHTMSLIRHIGEVAPYAESWRTTTDITDNWQRVSNIGFGQNDWAAYAKPGHFNDPDMLVIGYVGWREKPRPTRLTPNEQYSHISLWSLLSAPLLLGCDLEKLDDFTLNLITNDEVLAIDQDALGKQGIRVTAKDSLEVYAKPLEDGNLAIGLFNRSNAKANIILNFADLNIKGKQLLRDLWRQEDIGTFENGFEAEVAPHGVVLIKLFSN